MWLGASACAFDSTGDGGTPQDSVGNEATSDDDDAAGSMSTTSAESTATATTTATQGSGPDEGSDATGMDPQTDTGSPSVPGCPDPLPDDWVFCNDFDDANDAGLFSVWDPSGNRLAIVAGTGQGGSGGLQFTFGQGEDWTGRATVDFADSPDDTDYADGERLTEVYVRFYLRTQVGWPGVASGDLIGLSVRDVPADPFSTAVDVSVVSNSGELGLVARPNRCFTDGNPGCGSLTYLEPTFGMTQIWSTDLADTWHCIEVHLGFEETVGDGLIEIYVDGVQDGRRADYVFVEGWDGRGWNAFRLTGSWPGAPPKGSLQRWMDDLVISRARIGCE